MTQTLTQYEKDGGEENEEMLSSAVFRPRLNSSLRDPNLKFVQQMDLQAPALDKDQLNSYF